VIRSQTKIRPSRLPPPPTTLLPPHLLQPHPLSIFVPTDLTPPHLNYPRLSNTSWQLLLSNNAPAPTSLYGIPPNSPLPVASILLLFLLASILLSLAISSLPLSVAFPFSPIPSSNSPSMLILSSFLIVLDTHVNVHDAQPKTHDSM
jgi:hypothetical protein